MAKPFDATTKQLLEERPGDWLAYLGLPGTRAEAIDTDLATLTAEADRVLRVTDSDAPYLVHVEFQASHDPAMAERLLRYHVLLRYKHQVPVRSVVLLLRPRADGPGMGGTLTYGPEAGATDPAPLLTFRYQLMRVWEQSADALLRGGLGTLPLAPLANVPRTDLPGIVRAMERRITGEATKAEAGILWTATYVLMGLKFPQTLTSQLLAEVQGMEESVTYQAIKAKGRAEGLDEGRQEGRQEGQNIGRATEARSLVLRLGRKRLGDPAPATLDTLEGITGIEALENLAERLLEVETWDELLGA